MGYCTKCGKQNPDTAKFCVACGTALKASVSIPGVKVEKTGTENEKIQSATAKNKNTKWVIISVIGLLGLATSAYFLFFNKKRNKAGENKVELADTTLAESDYLNEAITAVDPAPQPADTTAAYYPPASAIVPLNPGNTNEEVAITQSEVDEISQIIKNFYQCENNEDVSCLLNRYSFPVSRYYQLYNVGYEHLHKLFTESFTEQLSYHHITLKWDYSTIQKIGNGYKAVVYADYEFVRRTTPYENRSRSIQIIIYFNAARQITSIYENQ